MAEWFLVASCLSVLAAVYVLSSFHFLFVLVSLLNPGQILSLPVSGHCCCFWGSSCRLGWLEVGRNSPRISSNRSAGSFTVRGVVKRAREGGYWVPMLAVRPRAWKRHMVLSIRMEVLRHITKVDCTNSKHPHSSLHHLYIFCLHEVCCVLRGTGLLDSLS